MSLTPASLQILSLLLKWDYGRIQPFRERFDCSAYLATLARAEVALGEPPESWPQEVRELFQALLETHGEIAAGLPAVQSTIGIGPRRMPKGPKELRDFETVRDVAREIGVLPALQGAGSDVWRRA